MNDVAHTLQEHEARIILLEESRSALWADQLRRRAEEAEHAHQAAEKRNAELSQKLEELEGLLAVAEDSVAELQAERDQLRAQRDRFGDELKDAEARLDELESLAAEACLNTLEVWRKIRPGEVISG